MSQNPVPKRKGLCVTVTDSLFKSLSPDSGKINMHFLIMLNMATFRLMSEKAPCCVLHNALDVI